MRRVLLLDVPVKVISWREAYHYCQWIVYSDGLMLVDNPSLFSASLLPASVADFSLATNYSINRSDLYCGSSLKRFTLFALSD
jgi:hypothetical protein